jgi:broad specificity phosphatase PhoE
VTTIFFITHSDVAIDPGLPIPDWPLNERGRARMRALAARPWIRAVRSRFASSERKARDGAQILVDGLGIRRYDVVDDLGENDRSATGYYLPHREFEVMVDAFLARPQTSVRGWESAVDAQARIIRAIDRIVSQAAGDGDLAIIGHGGTGTLLYCRLARVPIDRQPSTNDRNWFAFERASCRLRHDGWRSIDRGDNCERSADLEMRDLPPCVMISARR